MKKLITKIMRKLGWMRISDMPTKPYPVPVIKEERFDWQKLQMLVEVNYETNHYLHSPDQYMKAIASDSKKELLKGIDEYIETYMEDHGRYMRMILYVAKRK